VGAWYEIMAEMKKSSAVREKMGVASGTDLAGFEAQLAYTKMFYKPADAVKFVKSADLKATMQYVAEFSFKHGLLGDGAPDAGVIGIETPAGIFGNKDNVKLSFDATYMQMAAEGKL
jgi:NitT/TauT family transport system substrate-binding protein